MQYYETSALIDKNGNVKVVFQQVAKLIIDRFNGDVKGGFCACNAF